MEAVRVVSQSLQGRAGSGNHAPMSAKLYDAKFIWMDDHGRGRQRHVLFRRRFHLRATPRQAQLHLFADTRYRLVVNGHTVGHGPARFHVAHPEYDTHEISRYLRRGANVITVLVNSHGRGTFSADASIGGLIAWGKIGGVNVATGPEWEAVEVTAFSRDSLPLSFALGPAEILDARQWPDESKRWPAAVVLANPQHWGPLSSRSIPLLDEREVWPSRLLGTFAARRPIAEDIYHVTVCNLEDHADPMHRWPAALMTYLHSPREQEIIFGAGWGWYFVNGEEVKPIPNGRPVESRQEFPVKLRAGWNAFLATNTVNGDVWEFVLSLPQAAGVSVSAEREIGSAHTFWLAGPWQQDVQTLKAELGKLTEHSQLPTRLGGWRPWRRDHVAHSPYFDRCWDELTPLPTGAVPTDGSGLVLLYDFGTEVLVRPTLEFTAAPGTMVDLHYTERVVNGQALHGVQGVHMAERYIARAGRQVWQTLHPRGMRYLEVIVRGDLAKFTLHKVAGTRANYPVMDVGQFKCSDPVLNQIWKVGRDTEAVCMEDVFVDCPWRERGLYTGDMLVQYYINLATFGDHRLMRRCIKLFFETQGENGLLRACSHALEIGRHPDYTAVAVQAVWHYWARSGDKSLARELKPQIQKLLAGLAAGEAPGVGLFDGSGWSPYIDLSKLDRDGISCALNCFYHGALTAGAALMKLLGDLQAARQYTKKAAAVAAAIRREFWSDQYGAFVDRRAADVPGSEPSVAGNTLALLHGIATPAQAKRALAWLVDALAHNFRVPEPKKNSECNVLSYFSFYSLAVLYAAGKVREAEAFIRDNWRYSLERGAVTWWEYFVDTNNSLCHAWSGCPTHYLSTQVLGVQFPEPGNPNRVRIAPRPGTLTWAEGVYPHPLGRITVSWRKVAGKLAVDYTAPKGVRVEVEQQRAG